MALSAYQRRQLDHESPLKLSILSEYGDLDHVFLPLTTICSLMVVKHHQAEKISTSHAKTAAQLFPAADPLGSDADLGFIAVGGLVCDVLPGTPRPRRFDDAVT
jgi:hypothetical protein